MERKVRLDDGRETTLEEWGDRGPCVVAVHGITSSRKAWRRLGEALSGTYRLYAYDQRGHGDAADVEGPMTLARSVADLRCVVEGLPASPYALLGHSWGGAVAVLGGRELPFERVVAVDPLLRPEPAPGAWRRDYAEDAEADLALPPDVRARVLRERFAGAWHELDVEGKIHAMRAMRARAIADLGRDNGADEGGWDLRPVAEGYPKPLLLLLAGNGDSVIAEDDVERVRRNGGANVTLSVFADQGHNLHRTDFARFLAELRAFLAR